MPSLLPNQIKYNQAGHSLQEVKRMRQKYGENTLTRKKRRGFFSQYLAAFGDPIIKILLIALALNVLIAIKTANIFEPLGIAIALFLATFVSTISEYGSESAFEKMEKEARAVTIRVKRSSKLTVIDSSELVVGDVVILSAGERVPADGIIVSGRLQLDQSALNGESKEVEKLPCQSAKNKWDLSEKNQLFRGSVVLGGQGVMVVAGVGDNTFYGGMAQQMQESTGISPLKLRLEGLAKTIGRLGYIAAALIILADLFNTIVIDNAFQMPKIMSELQNWPIMLSNLMHAITLGITVIVVAVPEGLPMMITVVLSSNMLRMKRDKVMVRKLVGIETSGSVNILFSDKTGTITNGKLSVNEFIDINGSRFKNPSRIKDKKINELVLKSCIYNNESMREGKSIIGGNATDRAVMAFAGTAFKKPVITHRVQFDSAYKYSSVTADGVSYVKGAPEVIFEHVKGDCTKLKSIWHELTLKGCRVIALAYTSVPVTGKSLPRLELVGLLSIQDSLRRNVEQAVRTVKGAGIQVVMVTGDNADTAASIAARSGVLDAGGLLITSDELNALSDDDVIRLLPRLRVVARALPTDKSRLVKLSQKAGLVVGMTGDGINDAPALKIADVGFAMGSGTEVAKQAGDIVILDDNFASISKAILYGRTIFKSIRKFIVFQLTMNLCAVIISLIGPFIGIDTPVTVMQMLWINIIMDTLAGLAFAGEAPLDEYMQQPPKRRDEPVLNSEMTHQILCMGIFTVLLCLSFLCSDWAKRSFEYYTDETRFMTAFFALFVFTGVLNSLNARTHRLNLLANISKNHAFVFIMLSVVVIQILLIYFGGPMFRTGGLSIPELIKISLLSLAVIPADFIRKIYLRFKNRSGEF